MVNDSLARPLDTAINFEVSPQITTLVEARLRSQLGWKGKKLCVIARNGYTGCEKNWAHLWREDMPENDRREGAECREFMRLMLQKDQAWVFVVMEDRSFDGDDTMRNRELHCASYSELFGGIDGCGLPFAWVVKILIKSADFVVGVPTGPFHLAMAYGQVPLVGLWTSYFPSWWDEPRAPAVHLVGRDVFDQGRHKSPGSFERRGELGFPVRALESRVIRGGAVVEASECFGI
jgi:hypothetical protein